MNFYPVQLKDPSKITVEEIMNVVLVDDSLLVRERVANIISEIPGVKVIGEAGNSREAIAVVRKTNPDVVMLDVMMPIHNGMEVLKYIKNISSNTIVIMMTSHGSEETAVEAMKLGADDYLTKPLSYTNVMGLVEGLLEKKSIKLENIRLKDKIHETEAYLAHLVDNVNEAIISTDESGVIQSFNNAAERLWQKDEKTVVNHHLSVLFKNGADDGYVSKIMELTRNEGRYEGEFVFVKEDLSDFPGYLSTSIVKDSRGTKEGIVAVIRDLTNEKMLRDQLVESAKLASLGKVVEGMAHEIRNPLISMGGFARRLEREFSGESDKKKYLNIILDDVDRLEKMVKDVEDYVNFTKLHKADFHCIDIMPIIKETLGNFNLALEKIDLELDDLELPEIYADGKYLKELFFDIMENSIEAMPDGGRLKITFHVDSKYLCVRIEDSGKGMPHEKLKDIYDPFYTSKMSGSGTGLSKAFMIVEEHCGQINVDSKENKGTTVAVSLPIEKRQAVRRIQ